MRLITITYISISTCFIISNILPEICFVKIKCTFICLTPLLQLCKYNINAVLKVVTFRVIHTDTYWYKCHRHESQASPPSLSFPNFHANPKRFNFVHNVNEPHKFIELCEVDWENLRLLMIGNSMNVQI